MPPEGSSAREAVRQIEQEGPSGAGARARQARPAASRWPRPARAAAVDRERGGAVGGRKRPGRPRGSLGRALDRGRYGAADPARGRRQRGAGHRLHRRARLLGQGRGRAGDHGRSPRHRGGPDASRARRPLPRRQQQLVRPLRPFSPCRPQRPRHRGHRRDPRRRRHRHGARCKVHRRAGLRRRGRQHVRARSTSPSSGCSTPTATCSRTMLPTSSTSPGAHGRGATWNSSPTCTRCAWRAFLPSPPPATMVRPSRRRRPSRRTTRPPTFPRRSQSERWRAEQRSHRSRAQARQAAAEASSLRSSPRERASSRPAWAASTRQGSRERRSRPRTSRARSRCCSRSPRSSPPPSR